jgi:hypothetical protein
VLYVLVLIAVVVSVDLLFFKSRFWERLMANIGSVCSVLFQILEGPPTLTPPRSYPPHTSAGASAGQVARAVKYVVHPAR